MTGNIPQMLNLVPSASFRFRVKQKNLFKLLWRRRWTNAVLKISILCFKGLCLTVILHGYNSIKLFDILLKFSLAISETGCIISNKNGIYEFPNQLTEDLPIKQFTNQLKT